MKQEKITYPVFKKNQLLSDDDLNASFDYLDEQGRLTRANLIGTGIVCGLDVEISSDKITISPGQGITSDGYFIIVPEPEKPDGKLALTSHKAISVEDAEHLLLGTDESKQDPSGEVSESILELLPNGNTVIPTSGKERVLLLCYSVSTKDLKNECGTGDGKGAEETTGVRWLLIEKSKLDEITQGIVESQEKQPVDKKSYQNVLHPITQLPSVPLLERYDVPSEITKHTAENIQKIFLDKVSKIKGDVEFFLESSHSAIKLILPDSYDNDTLFSNFSTFYFLDPDVDRSSDHYSFAQYYYDFFDDLLKACEEFRQKGQKLLRNDNPNCLPERVFQRYLILGTLGSSEEIKLSENNRHYFHPSLASKAIDINTHIKELERLFNRLVEMVKHFTLPDTQKIRLIPSKMGDVPLSEKAIPCYYDEEIRNTWRCSQIKEEYREPEFKNDLEQYNFTRIEGHIGRKYHEDESKFSIEEEIKNEIKNFRIPIKVISLYSQHTFISGSIGTILSNNVTLNGKEEVEGVRFLRQSLSSFLKRNPGVQHKAGAPIVGTFIIVYKINKYSNSNSNITTDNVIADFFLPYYCCYDCVEPLTIDVTFECKKGFTVKIEKDNSTHPFFFQLNKEDFQQFSIDDSGSREVIINPPEGVHTLIVCDSEGAESAVHELSVPKPLTIGPPSYKDISDTQYIVSFDISGGTPQYTASDNVTIKYLDGK
ncbi:MAG: hypothetical protein D3922_01735, partial [Candidatus Electrothrix sp. AR1]|nr:hypothetical protein [Candidatus Electrothrix sp. AR1]